MYADLFFTFFKIGAFSFGGGYAMIPLITKEVVEKKSWLPMTEFVDVIAISQGTPGPIAINAATYVGHKVAGFMGSAAATVGVVLPSFIIMLVFGALFLKYCRVPWVSNMIKGIRPVVVALIAAAAFSVAPSSITGPFAAVVALAVVVLIVKFKVDPIILLVASGLLGIVLYR